MQMTVDLSKDGPREDAGSTKEPETRASKGMSLALQVAIFLAGALVGAALGFRFLGLSPFPALS